MSLANADTTVGYTAILLLDCTDGIHGSLAKHESLRLAQEPLCLWKAIQELTLNKESIYVLAILVLGHLVKVSIEKRHAPAPGVIHGYREGL